MVTVDLNTMTVKDNRKIIIKNGQPVGDYKIKDEEISIEQIEDLYIAFKYSIPSPKERKSCFKALSKDEMTMKQLVTGESRTKAREALEMTLVTGILNGSLKWPGNEKHWFWQSKKDKDLVLLKRWFDRPNN